MVMMTRSTTRKLMMMVMVLIVMLMVVLMMAAVLGRIYTGLVNGLSRQSRVHLKITTIYAGDYQVKAAL